MYFFVKSVYVCVCKLSVYVCVCVCACTICDYVCVWVPSLNIPVSHHSKECNVCCVSLGPEMRVSNLEFNVLHEFFPPW